MEPFEWLLLGAGLAIGGLLGANSKGVMRTAARGYLTVGEKTREWSGNMREDFQDAIEEARYDREESEYESSLEEEPEERKKAEPRKRAAPAQPRVSARSASAGKLGRAAAKSAGEPKGVSSAQTETS